MASIAHAPPTKNIMVLPFETSNVFEPVKSVKQSPKVLFHCYCIRQNKLMVMYRLRYLLLKD